MYDLRARNFGEIIDAAIKLYRDNVQLFLSLAALTVIPSNIISVVMMRASPLLNGSITTSGTGGNEALKHLSTQDFAQLQLVIGICYPLLLLGLVVSRALFTVATAELFKGEKPTVGDVISRTLPILGRAIISEFVLYVGTSFGLLLLIIPGAIFFFKRILNTQVIVFEGKEPMGALARSKELTKGDGGRVQWPWFFVSIITWVLIGGFSAMIPTTFSIEVRQLIALVPAMAIAPLQPCILTLVYLDYRVRKEGLDLELAAGGSLVEAPTVAAQ